MARTDPGPTGFALVDKPAGVTSHDVVAVVRRRLGTRKVGHAGTLDPDATGLLVVGTGRATRLLRFVTMLPKTYETELVLGVETSTLDASGEVTARHDMTGVDVDRLRSAADAFRGEIRQVPPMVSAVRVGGTRLHELARAGHEVERAPRTVVVHSLSVDPTEQPDVVRLEVTCSSGTYVRTLGADLAAAVGGGGHIRRLRRTASGSHRVADAVAPDEVGPDVLLTPAAALRDHARVEVDDDRARAVGHGRPLALDWPGDGPGCVVDEAGDLLAVYERGDDGPARPAVVVRPAS